MWVRKLKFKMATFNMAAWSRNLRNLTIFYVKHFECLNNTRTIISGIKVNQHLKYEIRFSKKFDRKQVCMAFYYIWFLAIHGFFYSKITLIRYFIYIAIFGQVFLKIWFRTLKLHNNLMPEVIIPDLGARQGDMAQ